MSNFKLIKTAAALALGASVVTSAVVPTDASAASKYKVKNGKLVIAKTGKVATGTITFNKIVYKNGVKLTGLKGKVYYKAGKKATGTYKGAYYVKGAKKVTTGTYNKAYYVKGKKVVSTGLYASKYYKAGKKATGTYKGAYYVNGAKKVTTGTYNKAYYVKGKKVVSTGTYNKAYYVDGKKVVASGIYDGKLYTDGVLNVGLKLEGEKLYKDADLNKGLVKFEDKYYFDADLANATYDLDGKEEAFENGVIVGAKVASVEAINATTVKVTFNKSLKASDAEGSANLTKYAVDGNNPTDAVLSEDKKSVVLTFTASIESSSAVVVVINPIETINLDSNNNAEKTVKYTQIFNYADEVKPEIKSVESSTNSSIASTVTINLTEKVAAGFQVKVDGAYVSAGYVNLSGETVTVSNLSLDATKSHTVELLNLVDLATTPNKTITTSKTFTITSDKVAPTVSLSNSSEKELVLTFDKAINETTLEALAAGTNGEGLVKDEKLADVKLTTYGADGFVKPVAGSKGKQFTVQVADTLFSSATSRTLTVLLPDTVTDTLGNKIATITKTITLTKDTTKPVATGYKLVKTADGTKIDKFVVTYNENVTAPTAKPTIVSESGVLADLFGTTSYSVDGNEVTYDITDAAISGKYTLSFTAGTVTDKSESANKNDAFNYTIDFGKSTATFTVADAKVTATAATSALKDNVITVDFENAVKGGAVTGSATDLSNYTLDGKPLPAGTTITLDNTQNVATITLPEGTVAKSNPNAVFTISNVQTLGGVTVKDFSKTLPVVDNKAPELTSAVINADGTLTVGFSEALAGDPTATDLELTVNGTVSTFTVATGTGADAGKYVLTSTGAVTDLTKATSVKLSTITGATATDSSAATNALVTGTTITVR